MRLTEDELYTLGEEGVVNVRRRHCPYDLEKEVIIRETWQYIYSSYECESWELSHIRYRVYEGHLTGDIPKEPDGQGTLVYKADRGDYSWWEEVRDHEGKGWPWRSFGTMPDWAVRFHVKIENLTFKDNYYYMDLARITPCVPADEATLRL